MKKALIFFSRGIDGIDKVTTDSTAAIVKDELEALGFRYTDCSSANHNQNDYRLIVKTDLEILRQCAAVLMDMTIRDRNYIGCVCEMVYAHSWFIPVSVYTGEMGLETRPFLRYHCARISRTRYEAIQFLTHLLIT